MTHRLDARMVTALAGVGAFGVLFTLAGAIVWNGLVALSVAIGAAIAAANLYVLAQIIAAMITDEPNEPGTGAPRRSNAGAWGILAAVKMVVLFAGVWLLMTKGVAAPIPMLVGYGSLPIGIAIGSLVSDKTAKEPNL